MSAESALRHRFYMEAALGSVTGVLAIATLVTREWIEILFGFDPDGGSGVLEIGIVVALAAATVTFGLLARAEWRHAYS